MRALRRAVKTVRPMLSERCPVLSFCLSRLSVCDVDALWPNGWTDQDGTWRVGRPRPWPHCVRRGRSSPSPKGAHTQFSFHICCRQMVGWIKMPPGREVGIGASDIVLIGYPALPPKKRRAPINFRPMSIVAKRLDGSRCHLVRR